MNSHKHARLTPKGRALLVSRVFDEGWSVAAASHAGGVSKRTGFKWLARFRAEGEAGLLDRSSRAAAQSASADAAGSRRARGAAPPALAAVAPRAACRTWCRYGQPVHEASRAVSAELAGASGASRAL